MVRVMGNARVLKVNMVSLCIAVSFSGQIPHRDSYLKVVGPLLHPYFKNGIWQC